MSIKENVKSFILWIKDQIDWFKGFFQQKESNKPSISSVLKLIIIYAWAQSYIKATALMKTEGIPPISWEWIIFLSAIVGLTQVTDIVNKYFSSKNGSK